MGTAKTITEDQADRKARRLAYQGATSVRIYEDGTVVSPADAPVVTECEEFWNYTWTAQGYRPRNGDGHVS